MYLRYTAPAMWKLGSGYAAIENELRRDGALCEDNWLATKAFGLLCQKSAAAKSVECVNSKVLIELLLTRMPVPNCNNRESVGSETS